MNDTNDQPGNVGRTQPLRLPPPRRPRRRRVWRVLFVLLVFVAGGVIGSGLTVVAAVRGLQDAIKHPAKAPPRITRRLTRQLDLTDEQAAEVLTIVTERQQDLLAIRARSMPEVHAVLQEAYEQIDEVLDAKQKLKWRKLFDRLCRNWLPQPPPTASRPAK